MTIILSRKDSRNVIIATTLLFLFVLLLFVNGQSAYETVSFDVLPWHERANLFLSTLVDMRSGFDGNSLTLAILGSLLGGINMSLAYTYMRLRGEIILRSGLYSGAGLVLAFIGIGCVACGTAFLSVILSLLGFSAMVHGLPYHGIEIGYVGLIILSLATYYLAKRVSSHSMC